MSTKAVIIVAGNPDTTVSSLLQLQSVTAMFKLFFVKLL